MDKGKNGCRKCWGIKMFILGVLILLNAYFNVVSWAVFIGAVLALKGLISMIWSKCSCKKR